MNDLNSFGEPGRRLEWISESPSESVDFLDLTFTIKPDGMLEHKTFQKPMNLHLYIPPNSAHSIEMFEGVIYGQLRHFHLQNSSREDFKSIVKQFYKHLNCRGYDGQLLRTSLP